jgi:hypothetical protein
MNIKMNGNWSWLSWLSGFVTYLPAAVSDILIFEDKR